MAENVEYGKCSRMVIYCAEWGNSQCAASEIVILQSISAQVLFGGDGESYGKLSAQPNSCIAARTGRLARNADQQLAWTRGTWRGLETQPLLACICYIFG